ncbi:MAG: (d)CMP kinase [Candidatus Bipolaricaulia bacterium]
MKSAKEVQPRGLWIAIDGPAGSGKTTLGRRLAAELGFEFINTGAMYRAVAWGFKQGLELKEMELELEGERVFLNGREITSELYNEELDRLASEAARDPRVRAFLIKRQRELAKGRNVVMEGRDIGKVVLPEAEVKIFLEASLEERARRRWRERDGSLELKEIEREIEERDQRDRGFERLIPAPDAIVIATDGLSIEEVVERALEGVRKALRDAQAQRGR